MKQSTALHVGDVLVVFEGASRVKWHRASPTCWIPVEVWPGLKDRAEVVGQLRTGKPVLVVLGDPDVRVPVTADELAGAPAAVHCLASLDGEVGDLHIPPLDWLPPAPRQRGLRFLAESSARIAATPRPLLPPALFDEVGGAVPQVRFVRQTRAAHTGERFVSCLVDHAFPSLRPAAVGTVT